MRGILKSPLVLPIATLITFFIGSLANVYINQDDWYQSLNKSTLNPPGYVFGIVWPILYVLMGLVSYFNFNQFKDSKGNSDLINFEDGKWVLSVYITDIKKSEESIYLMKQLNVALNRDINKLKRVAFFSNKLLENDIEKLLAEYPRLTLIEDKNGVLLNVLQRNSRTDFNIENPIFLIDPYGRAVMYFDIKTDPKLILKDLKVLI